MAGQSQSERQGGGRRRGIGCLLVLMGGLALLGMLGVMAAAAFSGLPGGGGDIAESVETPRPDAKRKLAIIEISGMLLDAPLGFGRPGNTTSTALQMLDRALEDEKVAGVLLRLDTPGGSVTDSDLIHQRVLRLRDRGKKVVVLMGDICASGGYYIAAAADEVWALPTTITGSIGVIIQTINVHELMEKVGVNDVSVVSGENKALLSPTLPPQPEHRRILQDIVDDMHARFVQVVADGRAALSVEDVRPLADGRIYTAARAQELKLIDHVGYREEAMSKLESLAEGGPFQVVRYERRRSPFELLGAQVAAPGDLAALASRLATPRAMYLFAP